MWLFTKYGFFSVVCAGINPNSKKADWRWMMVRARSRKHLVNLQNRFKKQLGRYHITANAGTDYRFRMFVSKRVMKRIIVQLLHEINWCNFKDECHKANDKEYDAALMRVWGTMYGVQQSQEPNNSRNSGWFHEDLFAKP